MNLRRGFASQARAGIPRTSSILMAGSRDGMLSPNSQADSRLVEQPAILARNAKLQLSLSMYFQRTREPSLNLGPSVLRVD